MFKGKIDLCNTFKTIVLFSEVFVVPDPKWQLTDGIWNLEAVREFLDKVAENKHLKNEWAKAKITNNINMDTLNFLIKAKFLTMKNSLPNINPKYSCLLPNSVNLLLGLSPPNAVLTDESNEFIAMAKYRKLTIWEFFRPTLYQDSFFCGEAVILKLFFLKNIADARMCELAVEIFEVQSKLRTKCQLSKITSDWIRRLPIEERFKNRLSTSLRGYLEEQAFQRASSTERIRAGSPGATNTIIEDLISGSIGSNEINQEKVENFDTTFGNK